MKLYVGKLPYNLSENDLLNLFSSCCTVLGVRLVFDSMGRSRGFGFIEVDGKLQMAKAIKSLHGREVSGREIVVNEALMQD